MSHSTSRLANGLRLITVPRHESKAVTVLVLTKVGSRHESAKINGVSHFLEHLMFKGTKKRPSTLDISKTLDAFGAEYNAFTSKDHTGYYIKIDGSKLRLAIDMLSDMLQHSIFDPKEVDRERGVIVEEINMYRDNPMMYVEEIFEETVFGAGTPLGQLIAGPRQVIKTIPRDTIVEYVRTHYTADNMTVVVAGRITQPVRTLVEKYFSALPLKARRDRYVKHVAAQRQPRLRIEYKKTEQVQLCLGFPALSYTDRDLSPLQLLSVILGGNMSSRLFLSIRERQGLCYFIKSSVSPYEDTGVFTIQSGLDSSRVPQAMTAILKELQQVARRGVTEEEVEKAREFLRGKIVLEMEDSESLASWYGRQALFHKKLTTPDERYRELLKITPARIQLVAKALFKRSRLNVAIIGPVRNRAALNAIIRRSL